MAVIVRGKPTQPSRSWRTTPDARIHHTAAATGVGVNPRFHPIFDAEIRGQSVKSRHVHVEGVDGPLQDGGGDLQNSVFWPFAVMHFYRRFSGSPFIVRPQTPPGCR